MNNNICVVIPAYEAEATIGSVICGVKQYIDTVVAVNDGSRDGTFAAAANAGAIVLQHVKNAGKGMALQTGFKYALEHGFDAVITMDADKQHDPDEIPKFLDCYRKGDADIIIGSRMHEKEHIPRYRYIPNQVGVACISWAAGTHFSDTQSGYRLYRRSVLSALHIKAKGFHAETEILIKASKKGFTVISIPIRPIYFPPGQAMSHYRTVIDTYLICITFLKSFFWR